MMTCERCGKQIPDNVAICPACGTTTAMARAANQPPTGYGSYPGEVYRESLGAYGQGYQPQQFRDAPPVQQSYMPPQQNYGSSYGPGPAANAMYPPGMVNVNIVNSPPIYATPAPTKNSGAVLVEVLLSLFLGIYGVGWLMAGETTAGIILLLCSFFVYWPVMIFGTIFTLGLGLLCLGPLAIGAIILNAILLNNTLNRKVAQYVLVQPR